MSQKERFVVCIHYPQKFFDIKKIEGGRQYIDDEICKVIASYTPQYDIYLGTTSSTTSLNFRKLSNTLGFNYLEERGLLAISHDLSCGSSVANLLIVVDESCKLGKKYLEKANEIGIETVVIPCKLIEEKINFKSFVLSDSDNKEEVKLIDKYSFCIHYEYDDYLRPMPERMESWTTLVYPEDKGIGLFLAEGKYRLHTLHNNGHWYYCKDNEELLEYINVSSEEELYNIIKNDVLYYVSNPTAPIRDKDY